MFSDEFEKFEDSEDVIIGFDEPCFPTTVVSKLLGLSVWTLKQLDKQGIVSPPRESENQARLYSQRELRKLKHCCYYMKMHKVNISSLKVILTIENSKK